MRADWSVHECQPEIKADWIFSRDEATCMRHGLMARTEPPPPAAVVASVRR
jgi:hypothetical protein